MNDLISRQAAINAVENTDCELSPDVWDEIMDAIMQVPSAERPKGKWIAIHNDPFADTYCCSECGKQPLFEWDYVLSNFCPYCGTEMECEE